MEAMKQNFDMTFCCHGDCFNTACDRFLQKETLAIFPQYRNISCADFKTDDCGYKPKESEGLVYD